METMVMPLAEYANGKIYSGIKTGFNEAFVINETKRAELVDKEPKSAEIIKPLVVGKDVQKWRIRQNEKWLIFTRRGININQYPALKEHLEQWREDLTSKQSASSVKGRKNKQYQWYEIQQELSYYQTFEAPKIIYTDIARESCFAFDTKNYYPVNTVSFIAKNDLFLIAILNSSITWNYFKNSSSSLRGALRLSRDVVGKLPIATVTELERKAIETLVGYILYLSEQLKDIPSHGEKLMEVADDKLMLSYFEQILDAVVMELYLPNELHTQDKHWEPIKNAKNSDGTPKYIDEDLVFHVELYRSCIMNPLSHAQLVIAPRREIQDAIDVVERLEQALDYYKQHRQIKK